MFFDVHPPKEDASPADRAIEREFAIGAALKRIIHNALASGWQKEEIALMLASEAEELLPTTDASNGLLHQ